LGVLKRVIKRLARTMHDDQGREIRRKYLLLRNINQIRSASDKFQWSLWYEKLLVRSLSFYRLNRWLPYSLFQKQYVRRGLSHEQMSSMALNELAEFCEDDRVYLKKVVLPSHSGMLSPSVFTNVVVLEVLLRYLLEDEVSSESLADLLNGVDYENTDVRLEQGDIVFDAGAFIGDFSALASVRGCTVHAFEPVRYLVENFLNKTAMWNKNITVHECALSDKKGVLSLNIELEQLLGSTLVKERLDVLKSDEVQVQATDLDSFINENNIPRVDFIKADIEGAERLMLRGAKYVLREFSPKLSLSTYHLPDDPNVMKEIIMDANPAYKIEQSTSKMYAYVPSRRLK